MAQKILITGGLGYLGSLVAPYLVERGFDVTILDTGFFRDSLLYPPPSSAARIVYKDARDVAQADLKGMDAVLHLAGISNDPFGNLSVERIYDPTRSYARNIASLCKTQGIRFVFASSCSVYGTGAGPTALDEDSPLTPQTPYSRNKHQIEQDLASLADGGFSPVALRFATAFGSSPRMRFDIVINMLVGMAAAEGKIVLNSDGQAWRPHVHILDIAESIRQTLACPHRGPGLLILNVGRDDNNMKILDVARMVGEECGGVRVSFLRDSPAGDDVVKSALVGASGRDTRTYFVSFGKIKEYLPEFQCRYSVRDGVREMRDLFRQIGLTAAMFRDPRFHRLQALDALFGRGAIDADLRWMRANEHAL
mgnify:CR=1 FL=1